jgi:hypothetical protein
MVRHVVHGYAARSHRGRDKLLVLVGYLLGPIRAEGVCCCRDRAVATGSANLLKITVDVMFAD